VHTSPKVTEDTDGLATPTTHSCGRAWVLPRDATSARRARAALTDALTELGVDGDTVDDAALMISELATNAFRHAAGGVPPELWVCAAGPGQIACAVFDGMPRRIGLGECLDDFGRGLGIVAELSGGRWGSREARSRLDPRAVPGKIVWFACSVPDEAAGRVACCVPDPLGVGWRTHPMRGSSR
jgi:hypothetical protein